MKICTVFAMYFLLTFPLTTCPVSFFRSPLCEFLLSSGEVYLKLIFIHLQMYWFSLDNSRRVFNFPCDIGDARKPLRDKLSEMALSV